MAIYQSDVYLKGAFARPVDQVAPAEETITITIPTGTSLLVNDLLYFAKIGENVDVLQADVTCDPLDSNAAATIAGSLGAVPSTTLKTQAAVVAVTGYNSIFTATTLGQNSGVGKNIQRFAGGGTGDIFNINPYPVRDMKSDLVMVISAAAATAITNTDRKITVRFKYQYAYPAQIITGVSASNYPFSGNIVYGQPITYTYNGNAP